MYLKSIEVQGFKSFANKLYFAFHNGITCIVGPNGSGKSNVADAVRWVLGEQSAKQLRGSSMQDVIFSGTENRKPQSSAYVAITLDNSDHVLNIDYDEVTVARRVYRSGESEYLINGNVCRLRQVQELFYDTGIGKEGYSIIGQGQIDRILSSKPEDRRELFDEAAGIVKFKRRKLEAVKKMESEHQNLMRVSDILGELEKQVGPLEKQSESARTYLKLREELKSADISLFALDYSSARKQLADIEDRIEIVSDELEETAAEEEKLRNRYAALDEYVRELDAIIETARQQSSEAELNGRRMEGQINVLTEQIHTGEERKSHITGRVGTIEAEVASKKEELCGLEEKAKELECGLEAKKQQRDGRAAALADLDSRIQEETDAIESTKGRMMELLNERASAVAQSERYGTILEQNRQRRAEVEKELRELESMGDGAQKACEEYESAVQEIRLHITQLDETERTTAAHIRELEEQIRQTSEEAMQARRAYHASHTKAESLQNLAERYEGYGNSVRRIMERRDSQPGILGVVADLIHTEKRYETAVETALGGSIQNVVTDTEQTAKQLVSFLKKNQYGRATFLPLDGIRADRDFSPAAALKEPGVIGLAADLVQADVKYNTLVRYLLGRVVVAKNIDDALALARRYRHSLRIVTLEGELLNPGGSITGGAFKNAGNLLGRRREIEELEKAAAESMARIRSAESRVRQLSEDSDYSRGQLEQMKESRQKEEIELNTCVLQLEQAKQELKRHEDRRRDQKLELKQLTEQMEILTRRSEDAAEQIRTIEEENDSSKDTVTNRTRQMEQLREARETLANEVSGLQVEYAALAEQNAFCRQNEERIRQEIARLLEEAESLHGGVNEILEEADLRRAEIASLKTRIADGEKVMEQARTVLEEKKAERDRTAAEQKQFFERREELTVKKGNLDKELFRLENQREQKVTYMEDRSAYLWSEYELMPSEASEYGNPTGAAVSELKQYVAEHKKEIRALGPVNVNAIEEYKDVLDRYTFLKGQYEDLVESEGALQKVIEELETGMRKQFQEQFAKITVEFNRVFQELFGGGRGTLELTEEDDVIEAGIRIIAQPPGKKLQNMMQMSGGEKALTAIALLFAIQNLKPSPFCLLDEIEAALDDANVGRFADYLHKLTKHTQFILISHRRGTMAAADRLYGITMQEKGVSALVSVNMIEQELDR